MNRLSEHFFEMSFGWPAKYSPIPMRAASPAKMSQSLLLSPSGITAARWSCRKHTGDQILFLENGAGQAERYRPGLRYLSLNWSTTTRRSSSGRMLLRTRVRFAEVWLNMLEAESHSAFTRIRIAALDRFHE